ncbi:tyrosine-type recombinase/integrase [Pseudodesulfovibrio sp.]|uniref:tyrosine-type recombinase/integrase n=1 Tax=unclassified Pseudodesulfovibrio TaxID=2661612 RepID=UPI003B0043AA
MATIHKRGKHQWQAKIRRKGYPVQSKTFERKTDAEQWARDIENEMDRGVFVSRKEAESTTLFEALDRFIEEYIPRLKMVANETRRAKAIQQREIANLFLASIRSKHIAEFIKEREDEGVKPNTIRLDLAILSRLFEVAATDWGMESLSNPVKRARKPKLTGGRTRRLQPAQAEGEKSEEKRLLEACSKRFRPVVQFAIETAMRRAEIANLKWENIDQKGKTAYLAETKNQTERTVPLSPGALGILKALPRRIGGSVFGMSENAITIAMRRAREESELKDLTFHDLRHEATSRLFENTDLDILELAEITGHKNLQMLKRYTHLRAERLASRLAGRTRT